MKMILKIHQSPHSKVAAICDSEILGKKFEDDQLQLDLGSSFYKGEEASEDEILKAVKNCTALNIVGEKAIGFALEKKLIKPGHIINIAKIPHAQTFVIIE